MVAAMTATAQERSSSSLFLQPQQRAAVTVAFDIADEGTRFTPTWGLDQAWINEQNLRKGINHMGKDNIGIGRTAFRFTKALTNDSVIAAADINYMRQRSNMFNIVNKELPLVFTADQEAGTDSYFVTNSSANVARWAAMINSHVHWMQQNTKHPIVGVSPFNEPDYWTVEEGATTGKQMQVAKLLKENYPRMEGIAIVGGKAGEEISGLFPPCGVCRQVMREFGDPKKVLVIMAKSPTDYQEMTLEELLPLSFGPENLN